MSNGIKDVAKLAGVSIATVSHVINKTRFVSPETKGKVEAAMQQLSYSPNILAKNLKENKSNVVGVIFPDISNFFFTAISSSIETYLRDNDYQMILCNSDESLEVEKQQILQLLSYRVCGIIIAPTSYDFDYRGFINQKDFPVVFLDRKLTKEQGDSVTVDSFSITKEAVDFLIKSGHRRIGFMGAHQGLPTTEERFNGYKEALRTNAIEVDEKLVVFGEAKMEIANKLCDKLIMDNPDMTALFVSSSLMSMGTMEYIVSKNIKVPQNIALICFDDYTWMRVTNPPLSSIKQPTSEMGLTAAKLLLDRLNDKTKKYINIILNATFIKRGSC